MTSQVSKSDCQSNTFSPPSWPSSFWFLVSIPTSSLTLSIVKVQLFDGGPHPLPQECHLALWLYPSQTMM